MEKKFFAIISVLIIVAMIFTSCATRGNESNNEAANASGNVSVSDETNNTSTTDNSTEEASKASTTETTTETTTEPTTAETTTQKQSTTQKQTTTQKQATTKKETTTQKPSTTKKNVTAEEVQKQVNDYIKSKGVTLDSSLNGDSSNCYKGEWSNTSNLQSSLNDGTALSKLKGYVDSIVVANKSNIVSAYCAYNAKNSQFIVVAKKKAETTKKNVTPQEVQKQVNDYIKSKGVILNPSMTPDNSSWSGQITRLQEDLNNGTTLRICKECVDLDILDGAKEMYCYYDSDSFYILFYL